jgi:formylglycine-generating enzyme required for sulfatase activity
MNWIIPLMWTVALALPMRAEPAFEGGHGGEPRSDNALKMVLHWCPAGEFVMGSPEGEPGRDQDEGQHRVKLTQGFWLGETEVTQAQWAAVTGGSLREQARKMLDDPRLYLMGGKEVTLRQASNAQRNELASVCAAEAPNIPIYYVSWDDAAEFCTKLTSTERAAKRLPSGAIYALPTESQWEYACRAGTTTATYAGDMVVLGENNAPVLNKIAFYGGNSSVGYKGRGWTTQNWPKQAFPGKLAGPRRVGQKQPNPWQFRDMLGNLYEWVDDFSGYYPQRDVVDPRGPATGEKKIFRGGSWNHYATMSRAARRFEEIPTIRLNYIGFRVALRLEEPTQTVRADQ